MEKQESFGGPFLLLNIPSAHFLWFTTAIILFCSARVLGGTGSFRRTLQVTGVALYSYLAIGLINYLHVWLPLPSLTLHASAFYRPNLGIGQLIVLAWLTAVAYAIHRRVHGLNRISALIASPLPVLISLLLYLVSAAVFFRVVPHLPGAGRPSDWLSIANAAYLTATVVLSVGMALVTRRWLKEDEADGRNP